MHKKNRGWFCVFNNYLIGIEKNPSILSNWIYLQMIIFESCIRPHNYNKLNKSDVRERILNNKENSVRVFNFVISPKDLKREYQYTSNEVLKEFNKLSIYESMHLAWSKKNDYRVPVNPIDWCNEMRMCHNLYGNNILFII